MHTSEILDKVGHFEDQIKALGFDECYVFGSVINRSGQPFVVKGQNQSDIDLIVRFAPTISSAWQRAQACQALLPAIQTLEQELEAILQRGDPGKAVSVVMPATGYELYHNIHEGQDISLLRTAQFLRPSAYTEIMFPLSNAHDGRYHIDNNELILAMRHCQQVRKEFLSITYDGQYPKLADFLGTDPAPKALMRRAALVNSWINGTSNSPDRTELIDGFEYLVKLLTEHESKEANAAGRAIKERSFPRGMHQSFSRFAQLLAAEILFDSARSHLPLTMRERIDILIPNS